MSAKHQPQIQIDKLKTELSCLQSSKSGTKLAELLQKHNADIRALRKKLLDSDLAFRDFQSQ